MTMEKEIRIEKVELPCFFQLVQLVITERRIVCRVAPHRMPIDWPFPLNSNQKPNEAAIGIPNS